MSTVDSKTKTTTCLLRTVKLTENSFIIDVLDEEVDAGWEDTNKDVEVKEERHPRGRLMLRHRGNDGDVNLGVAGVPQGVEPTTPRRNETCVTSWSNVCHKVVSHGKMSVTKYVIHLQIHRKCFHYYLISIIII